jgi:hypothetical protein
MTFEALKNTLQQLAPDEAIELSADLVGPEISALFARCLELDAISIEGASTAFPGDMVVVSGTTTLLGIDELDVAAVFEQADDALALRLTAYLPEGWMFEDSFPNLAGFLSFDSLNYGYRSSYLNVLDFAKPRLILASAPYQESEGDATIEIERGLNFRGDLSLTGVLEPLALIASSQAPLLVSGLLIAGDAAAEEDQQTAEATGEAGGEGDQKPGTGDEQGDEATDTAAEVQPFHLRATFPLSLGVDAFRFKNPALTLYSGLAEEPAADETTPAPADGGSSPESAGAAAAAENDETTIEQPVDAQAASVSKLAVSGELEIGGHGIELFSEFRIGVPLDFLAIGARPDLKLPGLGDIAALAGDTDLEAALPEALQDFGDLTVEQIVAGFSISERALSYLVIDVGTQASWTIIPDVLTIESLFVHWLISSPLNPLRRQLAASIAGQLALGKADDPDAVKLDVQAEFPSFEIGGALARGSTIKLGALLQSFGIPAPDDSLEITRLTLLANPKLKTFSIEAEIENVLTLDIDPLNLEVSRLALSLDYAPPDNTITLAGDVTLFEIPWTLEAQRRATTIKPAAPAGPPIANQPPPRATTTSEWTFAGELAPGNSIRLPKLVEQFGTASGTTITLPDGLDIGLTQLAFSVDTGASKEYTFQGAFDWRYQADGVEFTIRAGLRIRSWLHDGSTPLPAGVQLPASTTQPAPAGIRLREGEIVGALDLEDVGVDFFKNFTIAAVYTFKPGSSAVGFRFRRGALELNALFSSQTLSTGVKQTLFTVSFGADTTFGTILTLLAQIIDPDIQEFSLDPPWDELNSTSLSGLKLVINLTTKEVAIDYAINQSFFGGLVTIRKLTLMCKKGADGKSKLMIGLDASILGTTPPPWSAMDQPPPQVPGKGSAIFDLDYLGLGQHVRIENIDQLENITAILNALRREVVALPDARANPLAPVPGSQREAKLAFSSESGWLIGAQFALLDTIALSLIFNDPVVYGLRLKLSGAKAQLLAGLEFEILYRRISETIGVYHVELTLPDVMRQIQVGIVALTLPVVVLDIYTNGDFKIDLGFPWRGNFDRSFAIDVLIFTGAGGFYFNKLSAATATSVPKIPAEVGVFNPVIEFGLGLKIGLGRTFNKGPLKAEISITLQGVIQGVFAWFNPNDAALAGSKAEYYMVKGGVAIVGRVWGTVDFEVIKITIEVIARAMITFVVEAYRPTLITLSAEVSVSASITILFIEINFSFRLMITQSFTLGERTQAPWERLPAQRSVRSFAAQRGPAVLGDSEPTLLSWGPIKLWDTPKALDIYFLPAATRVADVLDHDGKPQPALRGVALMFIENAKGQPASDTMDFDVLVQGLLAWAISARGLTESQITLAGLEDLYAAFIEGRHADRAAFDFEHLAAFLGQNFQFRIAGRPADGQKLSASVFPVLPQLRLQAGGHTADFLATNRLNAADIARFADYFKGLKASHGDTAEPPPPDAAQSGASQSAASYIFMDYFALLIRSAIGAAVDLMSERAQQANERDEQATALRQQAHDLRTQAAALAARVADLRGQAATLNTDASTQEQQATMLEEQVTALRALADAAAEQPERAAGLDREADLKQQQAQALRDDASQIAAQAGQLTTTANVLEPGQIDLNAQANLRDQQAGALNSQATGLRAISLSDLNSTLSDSGELQNIAGMASRFMLHGLRLPWPNTTAPLYEVTGQQFALPASLDGFLAKLAKLDETTWITLADGVKAGVQPDPTLIGALKAAPALGTPDPQELPFYSDVPRHFSLEHHTSWKSSTPAGRQQIFDLPEPMRNYLSTKGTAGVSLALKLGTPALGKNEITPKDFVPIGPYAWATRVRLTIRRVPTPGGLLDRTYLMAGADEAGKDLLEEIWRYLLRANTTPALFLLYANQDDGGLIDVTPAASLLVKTNLSTESNPASRLLLSATEDAPSAETSADTYSAGVGDGANFVKLLWECSVVGSGGFYLHYDTGSADAPQGLPGHIFADGVAATLELLIQLDQLGAPAPARSFHNCVVTSADVSPGEKSVLLAESADTVKVLSLPPGHVGFQLARPALPANELERLYQLLGYRLLESDGFRASNEGLPVGPTSQGGWLYERMIPIFSFAKDTIIADQGPDLPPAKDNPYAGIKQGAQAQIEFYWQDVYGNRFAEGGQAKPREIRYVDPLFGINQWPTVAESYTFAPADAGKPALIVELVFDQVAYQPIGDQPNEQVRQKISAARALYERIYYQINQPDVGFTISTSVLPNTTHTFTPAEKGSITSFVNAAYRYLSTLEKLYRDAQAGQVKLPQSDPIVARIEIVLDTIAAGKPAYPADPIFPVTVQLDMARDPDLVDATLGVPEVQKAAAFLKAKTPIAAGADSTGGEMAALREFATSFEQALPGLRLAVGNDQPHKHSASAVDPDDPNEPASRPLWAAQLGGGGISYNIHEELPYFFTPAPLANTLLSATVEIDGAAGAPTTQKRVEAVDINVLAHDFLAAVEAFLEPTLVVPAMRRKPELVRAILNHKKTLASAIRDQVTHILEQTEPADIADRRKIAADMLHQQLLINLVEAYDIETIVQYNVDVELAEGIGLGEANPPRLYGQPVVKSVSHSSSAEPIDAALHNFTLSPGRVPLDPSKSYLTFFFNTRTPEKFEDLTLELVYRVNELEHDIVDVPGVKGYQASSWLSFVLPIDTIDESAADPTSNANYIGKLPIPIPLRTYPTPPSMVMHAAELDPDSQRRLEDIRQWQYTYVYEHLDVAQDAIEAAVRYNVVPPTAGSNGTAAQRSAAGSNVPAGIANLFAELVNFAAIYPQLAPALQGLASNSATTLSAADGAIEPLEALIGRVAQAWASAQIASNAAQSTAFDAQYAIGEITTELTKTVTIATDKLAAFPQIVVPGYELKHSDDVETSGASKAIRHHFDKKSPEAAAADPVFGESSIPDRKLTIPDLDIIGQQNAWGAIWLTRNKELVGGRTTNPVFVYQTPQVSFANMATPLLVNTRSWYIDTLGAADGLPQPRSLAEHIQRLFETLLPASADRTYDIRLACRYAFALVRDTGQDAGLVSTLPVLLGPRLTIGAGAPMLRETEDFRAAVAQAIDEWKERNKPLTTNGMYIFSLAIFSHLDASSVGDNTKLPLLRIEDLRLRLEHIVAAPRPVVLELA